MRILTATLLWVGVSFAVSGFADDESKEAAIAKDRAQIEGRWKVAKLVTNGNEAKAEDARRLLVVNKADGSWSLMSDGNLVAKGSSTIDPSATPKEINFTTTTDGKESETYQGIYELGKNKNQRKMCFAPAGKPRPTSLTSESGTENILVVFERLPIKQVLVPAPLSD